MRIISRTGSGVSRLAGLQVKLSKKARQRRWQRPYAIRTPRDYVAKKPEDIVEVDTLDTGTNILTTGGSLVS